MLHPSYERTAHHPPRGSGDRGVGDDDGSSPAFRAPDALPVLVGASEDFPAAVSGIVLPGTP
eukprot:2186839-Karenia_brevis.AAC.1